MSDSTSKVVVVGGGISGFSAAWSLQQAGIPYTLLEQSDRWGGKILTEQVAGYGDAPFVVEGGPDSFIAQKPWATELAEELGLANRLMGTNDGQRQVYVLNKGKPVPLPDGVLMIVPTKFKPFALSPLISPLGKLRMGMDLFIPARRDDGDETLADFIRRRLGSEALDKIAEPLMSGIYNAEADRQSLLATFPRFRDLEQRYGSLTKGMIASRNARQNGAAKASPAPNGRPRSAFITLRGGVNELVDALAAQLVGDLRLNATVTAIAAGNHGYTVSLADGTRIAADAVILCTPAFVSADLVRPLATEAADLLAGIRYVSTGTISLAFDAAEADIPLRGFGLVIPTSENRPINAITVSSTKFDHRAVDGTVLLRAFFGGSRSPQSMELDDEQLLTTVRGELSQLLGLDADPLFYRIFRWRRSNPQYDVGHLERVAAIEAALPRGLLVTGSAYRGVGIPDCVKQGREAARQAAELVQHASGFDPI
ncbi:MAG: protoporphyrinogen oxidase [Caldilineales bacterium]